MIKTFRHKGLESFFRTGSMRGIRAAHAKRLRAQLTAMNVAKGPRDLAVPGWRLHRLAGDLKGHWSLTVNGNWRLTFAFEGDDVVLVDYLDYH